MTVSIKELTFDTIIGLLDFERVTPQKVIVDCEIDYDYESKDAFINYALVAELIKTTMHKEQFELIETALIVLINDIKTNFPLSKKVSLKITKPTIIDDCKVSVSHFKSFL